MRQRQHAAFADAGVLGARGAKNDWGKSVPLRKVLLQVLRVPAWQSQREKSGGMNEKENQS